MGVVPNLFRHWPIFAAALAATVHVRPAHACGATPCAQLNDIQPPEGSVGVPLNTEIRVLYFGMLSNEYFDTTCDLDLRPMRLQPDRGEPIYLTGTVLPHPEAMQAWVIAQHVEPLAADTSYAVQLLLAPGRDACGCGGREWTTVSSFTSGETEDHEPPSFAGLDSLEYGERLQGSSPCGGTNDLIYADPELTPVSDADPAPRYNVYVNGQIAKRYVEEIALYQYSELFVDCGTTSLTPLTAITPGGSVEIRAVDLAGNESAPNTPLTIDVTCEVVPVDLPTGNPVGIAGTTGDTPSAATDSSAPVVTSASTDSSSGCDLSRTSGMARDAASGAGAAALAGVLLLLFGGRVAARRRGCCNGGRPQRPRADLIASPEAR